MADSSDHGWPYRADETDADDGPVVNYYFPVRIEVVGSLSDDEVQRVADHVFDELDREMTTRI